MGMCVDCHPLIFIIIHIESCCLIDLSLSLSLSLNTHKTFWSWSFFSLAINKTEKSEII